MLVLKTHESRPEAWQERIQNREKLKAILHLPVLSLQSSQAASVNLKHSKRKLPFLFTLIFLIPSHDGTTQLADNWAEGCTQDCAIRAYQGWKNKAESSWWSQRWQMEKGQQVRSKLWCPKPGAGIVYQGSSLQGGGSPTCVDQPSVLAWNMLLWVAHEAYATWLERNSEAADTLQHLETLHSPFLDRFIISSISILHLSYALGKILSV